jgi:hypothetical protein
MTFFVIIAGGKMALVYGFQRHATIPLLSLALEAHAAGYLTVARPMMY